MNFDAVLILGKELRRDAERARAELRARSAAAAVALRRGVAEVWTLEARLRGQAEAGSDIVRGYLGALGVPPERVERLLCLAERAVAWWPRPVAWRAEMFVGALWRRAAGGTA